MIHPNLMAYNGGEDLNLYDTEEALGNYRQHLLDKSEKQRLFIEGLFEGKIDVLELCSGNSRLLYALKDRIKLGMGVEISRSRYEFAERWKHDLGVSNVVNICGDVMEFDTDMKFDLVMIMSNAFMYFEPIDKSCPAELIGKVLGWLKPGGKLVMEIRDYLPVRQGARQKGNAVKISVEYPEADPFSYLDTLYVWHSETRIMELKMSFTRRDGGISNRHEVLRVYNESEMREILRGFSEVSMTQNTISPTDESDKVLVIAEK